MSENIVHKDEVPSTNVEEEGGILVYMINAFLVIIIVVLIYKIIKGQQTPQVPPPEPELPKLKKRDFTVEELKPYDGTGDGRILIACNGKVFDITKGRRFYGPDGPYAAFAGRDASRGFATFTVTPGKEGYDDLSDLTPAEWESVREWEEQLSTKYTYVGKLLKPGEEHTKYEEEEDEKKATTASSAAGEAKKEL